MLGTVRYGIASWERMLADPALAFGATEAELRRMCSEFVCVCVFVRAFGIRVSFSFTRLVSSIYRVLWWLFIAQACQTRLV